MIGEKSPKRCQQPACQLSTVQLIHSVDNACGERKREERGGRGRGMGGGRERELGERA
jgi:hypothetical protein